MFVKQFLKNQEANNIAFITLEDINKSYLKKLIDFFNKEKNRYPSIKFISSQNGLEECTNVDCTILFTSVKFASYEEIISLSRRFNLLKINLKGFVLLD